MSSGRHEDTGKIRAAGTVTWRIGPGGLEVALVHRPAYDDWSWAKGKLGPQEPWPAAAARETREELGLSVRLGVPLPSSRYQADGHPKEVRYWSARVTGGDGKLLCETDAVRWLTPGKASRRLTYEQDNNQLSALVRRHDAGTLDTAVLIIMRHALAVPRRKWHRHDQLRPLTPDGIAQARALPPVLAAYGVTRLVSSSAERCATTFRWAGKKLRLDVRLTSRLTEEGFAAKPGRAIRILDDLAAWTVQKNRSSAVCIHGPLIAPLLTHLAGTAGTDAAKALRAMTRDTMGKGELAAIHLVPGRKSRHVVAVERHQL